MKRSEHIIDRYGMVGCPNVGDVVAQDCFACAALDSVREEDGLTLIACRPQAAHMPRRDGRTRDMWIRFLSPSG